ncbi:hypothetical protein [Erythrobacter sp. NFXS35]|uniref:hypothetical protein n=1 Tax=Erythrobacter sp. NFXS35 TaxID=2818436 RepID=UPI0032DEE94B
MKSLSRPQTPVRTLPAWTCAALAGFVAPALAMLMLADPARPASLISVGGPILAIGLMGVAMIAAAAAGRMWIGVALALLTGFGLILWARTLGLPPLPHPFATGFAVVIASISFAARGALFAKSASDKGWLIAVFVVAGEAAILFTAAAVPDALPDWLLALLPAQWASTAIQTELTFAVPGTGTGTYAATSALFALAGTAAATLLVVRLWPRRWPYLIMFTAWLALSALVWHRPAPPMPSAELAFAVPGVCRISG